jgi:hypothetical protein
MRARSSRQRGPADRRARDRSNGDKQRMVKHLAQPGLNRPESAKVNDPMVEEPIGIKREADGKRIAMQT